MAGTKECIACDAKIAESEKTCPACGVNIEELEDAVSTVEAAQKIIDKRKAKVVPPPVTEPPTTKKAKSKLLSLGSAMRKRG